MKRKVVEVVQILLAVFLASIGLKAFLLPNGFLDGGVTGIAILLRVLTGIKISYLLIVLSLPFLVLGKLMLNTRTVVKSAIAIVLLAIVIHFENFIAITDDKLLISIFGGIFLGSGIGIAIRNGTVLDGSEILGIYINEKYGISIGKVILVFNIILFSITASVLSIESSMYSVLTYLVTAKIVDLFIEGFEDFTGLMIVSTKIERIEEELIEKIGVGLTVYKGARGFGKTGSRDNLEIVHMVINRIDIKRTYNLIDTIDEDAFIIEFDVNNVKGGIHRKLIKKI